MNIVKWMRKNNRKLMAFVVIFIMVAFVGGTALQQIMTSWFSPQDRTMAEFRGGGTISPLAMQQANAQLQILQQLGIPTFLRFGSRDLASQLLGQVLFPDPQAGAMLNAQLKMMLAQGGLQATEEQVDEFFREAGGMSEVYWILLREEARQAGVVVPMETAAQVLRGLVQAMYQGQVTAAQVVSQMMKQGTPEAQVLGAVRDLFSILTYAQIISANDNATLTQMRAEMARGSETISAEYVKFDAQAYLANQPQPTPEQITEQFNRFRDVLAGPPTEQNPYGFGYKLPARVQLDYLVIENQAVEKIIPAPTNEEKERYYQRNLEEYKYQDTADPNNPVEKIRSYPEVAGRVERALIREKTNSRVNMIINEARSMAESGLTNLDMSAATPDQVKAASADFNRVAQALSEKYGVPVHAGRTGLLSMQDVAADRVLGQFSVPGIGENPVRLMRVVFAVEGLEKTELGRFDVPNPRMWEPIGPFRDRQGEFASLAGLVRVVDAEPEEVAASPDVTYANQGVNLGDTPAQQKNFSLRQQVAEDVRLLAAMEQAGQKASQFLSMVNDDNWSQAVQEFNQAGDPNRPAAARDRVRLATLDDRQRQPLLGIRTMLARAQSTPTSSRTFVDRLTEELLLNDLYMMLEPDQNQAENMKEVFVFEPGKAVYAIKSISRTPAVRDEYLEQKPMLALQSMNYAANSSALAFFDPKLIRERMDYEVVGEPDAAPDAEEAEQAEVAPADIDEEL